MLHLAYYRLPFFSTKPLWLVFRSTRFSSRYNRNPSYTSHTPGEAVGLADAEAEWQRHPIFYTVPTALISCNIRTSAEHGPPPPLGSRLICPIILTCLLFNTKCSSSYLSTRRGARSLVASGFSRCARLYLWSSRENITYNRVPYTQSPLFGVWSDSIAVSPDLVFVFITC